MSAVQTTYTTDVETSTRSGTQLTVDTNTTKQNIGNFVTDVSMQPYIAAEVISFYAFNIRKGSRVHCFFDSVNVDAYCAPGVTTAANTTSLDTSKASSITKKGAWGDPIYADDTGHVYGQFAIPAGKFKTGDRVFTIADTDNLILGADALTTKAAATFTASNMSVTKESVTLSTVNPIVSVVPVTQTVTNTTYSNTTINLPDIVYIDAQWEPIAQGLTINTPDKSAGLYATALGLYFKQKSHLGNGVTVYLTEINNGYPDGTKILPGSTVHLMDADINTSTDASIETLFYFENPIFLNNGVEYAFVCKPDGNDTDIWVYSAALGDVDIKTGNQMYSQPVTGTAFFGATANEWTALQTEYIKFRLLVARFNQSTGDVYFNNSNTDYISIKNIAFNNPNTTILPGDTIYQSGNSTVTTVNTSILGTIAAYDNTKNIITTHDSSANFSNNAFFQVHRFANNTLRSSPGPNTSTLVASGNTGVLYNPTIDSIVGQFSTLLPSGTSLSFDYKGAGNNYVLDTTPVVLTPGIETDMFDKERIVASVSNEVAAGVNKTHTIHAQFRSDSAFLSPAIDLVKANALAIGNQVDPVSFDYNEYYNNGAARTKYISQLVTLAAGQDAQDLQIHITAHRPAGTDMKVYVKFLNSEDAEPIVNKTWTPMVNLGYNTFCDPGNPNDTREYVFQTFPYYGLTPTTGVITANSVLGNTVNGVGTLFSTELKPGQWINMPANTTYSENARQVISIASNTSMTISAPFGANYTTNSYFIVPPPTTAWNAKTFSTLQTGNVDVSTTTNIITGHGTNFLTLLPGQEIGVAQDQQTIVSVTNATSLTVQTPWSSTVLGANAYLVSKGGVSYLNGQSAFYTTFNRFQIKVILQSNDSSKVPQMMDLRALAMQL